MPVISSENFVVRDRKHVNVTLPNKVVYLPLLLVVLLQSIRRICC